MARWFNAMILWPGFINWLCLRTPYRSAKQLHDFHAPKKVTMRVCNIAAGGLRTHLFGSWACGRQGVLTRERGPGWHPGYQFTFPMFPPGTHYWLAQIGRMNTANCPGFKPGSTDVQQASCGNHSPQRDLLRKKQFIYTTVHACSMKTMWAAQMKPLSLFTFWQNCTGCTDVCWLAMGTIDSDESPYHEAQSPTPNNLTSSRHAWHTCECDR